MAKFSKNQCRSFIYYNFLRQGWLPPGTNTKNWEIVTIKQLNIDNPPLPGDPHFQKRKAALDLQDHFITLGGAIKSPLVELKKSGNTLSDLAGWCFENQMI